MSNPGRDVLRRVFLLGYQDLRSRLTRRLGSVELASDALHETWLRIHRAEPVTPVRSPRDYLLRIAFNVALQNRGIDKRFVSLSDAMAAIGISDDAPDPEHATVARSEVEALVRAIAELTPRRRAVLLAARLDGTPLREIAMQLDVSQRLVEIELKHALAHCALRLDREVIQRFGPRPPKESSDETVEKPGSVRDDAFRTRKHDNDQ